MSSRRIGIVYWDTGFGIARDAGVLETILVGLGYRTRHVRTRNRQDLRERRLKFALQAWRLLYPAPLQLHLEQINREQFRFARRNLFFPNPEFTDPAGFARVTQLTAVCCKTRHALERLTPIVQPCEFTGFTSPDRYVADVAKDFGAFFHLAGKSDFKGTERLLRIWAQHPEWPRLTILWSPKTSYGGERRRLGEVPANVDVRYEFLSETELLTLQNRCGIHLCPSETEGFGHYLNEARSTGAVVVATDAPPMNEFVTPETGFVVPARPKGTRFMSTLFEIEEAPFEAVITRLLATPPDTLAAMGARARARYLADDAAFHERTRALFQRVLAG